MRFFKFLESIHWAYGALVVVTLFVLLTLIILLFVRRRVDQKGLKANHDVAGFVFANVGVLYAVLLGFTVVSVQERFNRIRECVHLEASLLAQIHRDSEVFSEKDKQKIKNAIKSYGDTVINEEWGKVPEENIVSHKTVYVLADLWKAFYGIELITEKQRIWYGESIQKLNQLMSARITRLLGSKESLKPEMWTFLLVGGAIMITFICFFGLEDVKSHILMAVIMAACTAFLLFLIYSLDTVFAGGTCISPDVLTNVLQSLD